MSDFAYERSWAIEPLWYEAPYPEWAEPRPYQHAAVEYALARPNCLIGDAPGVGKTAEGVLLSNAVQARRTLVVCPASLRLNWEREVWHWSTIPYVQTYPVLKARDGVSPEAHYVIISYDLLRNWDILRALMEVRWDHLICDEAHYLKDPKGNTRVRPLMAEDALRMACGRITMLTGTPMPNQPIEIYNVARILDWDCIDRMSVDAFRDHYYDEGGGFVTRMVWDEAAGRKVAKVEYSTRVRNVPVNGDELRERLRSSIMVRRHKEDVLPQLPERQWHLFPLVATPDMRRALRHPGWETVSRWYELDPSQFDEAAAIDGEVSTARRLLGEAKAPAVAEYVEQLLREGAHKVVVSAWHRTVLDLLCERLERYGLVYMDGRTSDARKQEAVDAFQGDDDVRVILGQMQPLGKGWTLTAAQDCVLAEPFWVPGENDQFLDRIHRYGQRGDRVIGHVPVVPDSLDERILARAVEKDRDVEWALDGRR